ncbi:MAG: alpha amylase N-terminal ig-like domain-containing protein [Halanaerobiales bacterium]|nr:alpha amylase N-terminal ig-like domain-containing protein [Halanaerobiales bacterium]
MNKAAVFHQSIDNFAYPLDDSNLRVRIITAKNDLKNVKIVYGPKFDNYKDPVLTKTMDKIASDNTHDYYSTKLHLNDPRFRYHFLLEDFQGIKLWYNEKGFFENRPRGHECGFFQYPIITDWEKFKRPDWLNDAVIYQIFPERFNNGNPDISPKNTSKWGDKPEHKSFFGGDLEGIIEKLDYIKELGANAIYLTPIFESGTNHKYNIADYFKIDPHFGDLDTIKTLVSKAHKKDIKVILDAVFNHCDINFFAFQDLIKKGENSKYKDWFFYEELPIKTKNTVNYVTFATDVKTMPKLNTTNLEVQNYLLDVAKYWMEELNIDGWRLDVSDEVEMTFWNRFRKVVKDINPEAVIIGEVWHSARKWLRGERFDTVMNYPFNWAVLKFFGTNEIGVEKFSSLIINNYYHYREDTSNILLNLLSSHDIPRIYEYCKNEEQLKLAILFLLTFPGIPMVYYGDELGLKGKKDPDNRRCMPWDKLENNEILKFYKKLIQVRKDLNTISNGDFEFVLKDEANNIVAFKRKWKYKNSYVILNNSHIVQNIKMDIEKSGDYRDVLNDRIIESDDKTISIILKPYEGKIITHP